MAKKPQKKAADVEEQPIVDEQSSNNDIQDQKNSEQVEVEETDKSSENKKEKKAEPEKKSSKAKKSSSKEKIERAQKDAVEWQDKYMRLSAEFDNYRKRTLKEKADLTKSANADLLTNILSVVDDFERGIDHLDEAKDIEALKEGILLIYNKFGEFLKQNGVSEIDAKEQEFDLDYHEALTKIPAPSEALKGKVVDVIEKGYLLNDKVIRYAKVVVGE